MKIVDFEPLTKIKIKTIDIGIAKSIIAKKKINQLLLLPKVLGVLNELITVIHSIW